MIGNHLSGCSVARSSRLVWDEEVAGSNPATPTKTSNIVTGFFSSYKTFNSNYIYSVFTL